MIGHDHSEATTLHPIAAALIDMDVLDFDFWSGASIHEVAQVVATGFQRGDEAGEFAVVVKLSRVLMLAPYFPKSYGKPRVDDRRVLSGIIFVNCNGLRWRDAPKEYGPHKTLYNRWKRWGEMGVFGRMMEGLVAESAEPGTMMIDATYLKAHHTTSSLRLEKGGLDG